MKKIYYLSTCSTCKRIMDELDLPSAFKKQDIKTEGVSEEELDEMVNLSGSYESLFNRRSQMYKNLNLKGTDLKEEDYKGHILEHYSFLKRPVIINNDEIYIGNSKKTVAKAKKNIV